MDIKTINSMEKASVQIQPSGYARLLLAFLFIALVFIWTTFSHDGDHYNIFLTIGAVFGAYMAMNIGANDVANNVGPAVGSKALTIYHPNMSRQLF